MTRGRRRVWVVWVFRLCSIAFALGWFQLSISAAKDWSSFAGGGVARPTNDAQPRRQILRYRRIFPDENCGFAACERSARKATWAGAGRVPPLRPARLIASEFSSGRVAAVSRIFRTFGLAERHPALARAVMAPLIC
jgi:hypothetical protein